MSKPAPVQSTPSRPVPLLNALLPLGALAAGYGILALPAAAQEVAAGETTLGKVTVVDEVANESRDSVLATRSTAARGDQAIRDIPQSLNVITEKLLDDRKVETLNQALRMTAGVTFSAAENGTQQDTFIRGFSVAQVGDLLIDGMKDPSQYDRDTFNYDRIEVMRGSASMIYGRGSTGGVVNQVAKKPMLANLSDAMLMVGPEDYRRALLDVNVRTGEATALRLNAMYQASDNYGAGTDKKGLAPGFSWGLGTDDEFTASLFHLSVDNTPKNGSPYAVLGYGIDPDAFYGAASDYLRGEANYAMLQHTHRVDGGGVLRSKLRAGRFERSQWYSTYRLAPGTTAANFGASTALTRVGLTPRNDEYRGVYFQSDYSVEKGWFALNHALLVGIDGARETADRYVSSNVGANFAKGTSTIGRPDDGFTTTVVPAWTPSNDYVSRNAGVFVQDLVEVLPGIKLLGGLRWDRLDGTFNTTAGTGATATRTRAELADSLLSHRFGILWQPSGTLSFHASYGTSFNTSGDTYQFTSAVGAAAGTAAQAAAIQRNANTPPEKSRNLELGAKLDFLDGSFSTRLALFRTEKYNERTTDADFAGDAYLLSGRRHSQGLELELAGRPWQPLELYLSYAFIPDSAIDETGSAAQNTVGQPFGLLPRYSGSAWATYQATPKFRMGAGINASSESYSINGAAPTRGARAPGFAVFDALAEYYVTPDLYVQVNGTNLTDKVYATDLYRGFMLLGQGRFVRLTVGYTY